MNRSGKTGMELHQALSFSSFLMKVPETEAIFFPGCALMNLDGDILERCLHILRRSEAEIQLCTCCCGQPSAYLFPEKFEKYNEKLKNLLLKKGVKRIYTGCPNCTVQLKKLANFEVIPIWIPLSQQLKKEDVTASSGSFLWHDPCPTRRDAEQQKAVRQLLRISGCDYIEPEYSGSQTRCCGNFHMLHTLRPETAEIVRKRRLAEFPEDKIILSSCEGCLSAFRSEGREVCNLMELLFGKSHKRGWGNRISTTFKQK